MAFTIAKEQIIAYPPEELHRFYLYRFEWIDNLHFLRHPSDLLGRRAGDYIALVHTIFCEAGWRGDGEIQLLWLPPFVFPWASCLQPEGIVLWHVKQQEDGLSYLLSPIVLPFEQFNQ